MLTVDLSETPIGTVVRFLHIGREETTWKLVQGSVMAHALAAFSPPGAGGVCTAAFAQVLFKVGTSVCALRRGHIPSMVRNRYESNRYFPFQQILSLLQELVKDACCSMCELLRGGFSGG